MFLAALAVPQGGATKTPLTAGCCIHFSTACWSSNLVKSKGMMLVTAPADLCLSTATEFVKPCRLKHAVTPPVPAKSSKIIVLCSVKPFDFASSQSCLCFGIPSLRAVQNACALKQLALKQTCRPRLQAPPMGAWAHSDRLKLKHSARRTSSIVTSNCSLDTPWCCARTLLVEFNFAFSFASRAPV